MTFAARTPHAWRNPHLAGFVALLFTALTLLAAAPHRHAGTNVRETTNAGHALGGNRAPALTSPLSSAASSSSCALCDWLTLHGLPTAAPPARLTLTVLAFVCWVPAPISPIRVRILFWQQPRGPPAIALS